MKPAPDPRQGRVLASPNRFKLATFGFNSRGGSTITKAAGVPDTDWDLQVRIARLSEAAAIEAVIPGARWKGYGGETDFHGRSYEDAQLGGRPGRPDPHRAGVRHGPLQHDPPRPAGQDHRHGGPHRQRPARHQLGGGLERRRGGDVRRRAAHARGPLRLRRGLPDAPEPTPRPVGRVFLSQPVLRPGRALFGAQAHPAASPALHGGRACRRAAASSQAPAPTSTSWRPWPVRRGCAAWWPRPRPAHARWVAT